MPGFVLQGRDIKMGECTRQTCLLSWSLLYILVMIKLIGFIEVSFLANKYVLTSYSVPGTGNIIIHQIHIAHALVNLTN